MDDVNKPTIRQSPQLKPLPPEGKTDPSIKIDKIYQRIKKEERLPQWMRETMKWSRWAVVAGGFIAGLVGVARGNSAHAKMDIVKDEATKEAKSAVQQAVEDERRERERNEDEEHAYRLEHIGDHQALEANVNRMLGQQELILLKLGIPKSKWPKEE